MLTSREKMRECIQYLQSLRAIVDAPPVAPTRSLAKTKAPSIDKVGLNYGQNRDYIEDIPIVKMSYSRLNLFYIIYYLYLLYLCLI